MLFSKVNLQTKNKCCIFSVRPWRFLAVIKGSRLKFFSGMPWPNFYSNSLLSVSVCLSIYQCVVFLSIYLCVLCLSINLCFVCLSSCLSVCLIFRLFVCPSFLFVCPSVCPTICLFINISFHTTKRKS